MILPFLLALSMPLHTPSGHPMQYYVSLPRGWSAKKRWPVALLIESADRDFEKNMGEFEAAREDRPYILVEPLVVTNGGARVRDVPSYHYSPATWDQIERAPYKFDEAGIRAVLKEVARLYRGEPTCYLTGWEAGGHTCFALLHNSWDIARGAVLVCPNFQHRWFSPGIPIDNISLASHNWLIIGGSKDPAWRSGAPIRTQATQGLLEMKSVRPKAEMRTIAGYGHGSLAAPVLDLFDQMRR